MKEICTKVKMITYCDRCKTEVAPGTPMCPECGRLMIDLKESLSKEGYLKLKEFMNTSK